MDSCSFLFLRKKAERVFWRPHSLGGLHRQQTMLSRQQFEELSANGSETYGFLHMFAFLGKFTWTHNVKGAVGEGLGWEGNAWKCGLGLANCNWRPTTNWIKYFEMLCPTQEHGWIHPSIYVTSPDLAHMPMLVWVMGRFFKRQLFWNIITCYLV